MNKNIVALILILLFSSCTKKQSVPLLLSTDNFIRAADLSFLPEIEQTGYLYYNRSNINADALSILKKNGCNTVRIRLWHTPVSQHSSFDEVLTFSKRVKSVGLKVWLDIHYSDTWADPSSQTKPAAWQLANFATLKDSVYNYTKFVTEKIKPDFIQIGNEINGGLLLPDGDISNIVKFKELLQTGCKAVRDVSSTTKIMIHFAGIINAEWFFTQLQNTLIDYDIIALSYYPIWHGKNLDSVKNTINSLIQANNKKLVIAETAYPFTFDYNDYTNNIIGSSSQIIPTYPATPDGQLNFLTALKNVLKQNSNAIGFCYWGGEWTAYRGSVSTLGSSWENQALFDFNNKELPATAIFKK